jgi:hypothetical protein
MSHITKVLKPDLSFRFSDYRRRLSGDSSPAVPATPAVQRLNSTRYRAHIVCQRISALEMRDRPSTGAVYCALRKQIFSPSSRYSAEQTSPPQIIVSPA